MIQLTSRGNYAILAVYFIAQRSQEEYLSIDEITENSQIPKPYLSKILQDLCRGGILISRRGAGGGFMLARAPHEISLKDIIEIIEGKIYIVNCLFNTSSCGQSSTCPIAPVWAEVQNFVLEIIGSISMADIMDNARKQRVLNVLETCQKMYHQKIHEAH